MSKRVRVRNFNDDATSFLRHDAVANTVWELPTTGGVLALTENLHFVNVKMYGVVGDGVTDDTAAIQAVLDGAVDGSTIFFPVGSYLVSDTLEYDKWFNILGEGALSRIITNNNITVINVEDAGGDYVGHPNFRNFQIRNLNAAPNSSSKGVRIAKSQSARFDNVNTRGFYHNIELVNCFEWTMNNVTFMSYTNAGLRISSSGIDTDRGDSAMSGCQFTPYLFDPPYSIYQSNGGGLKISLTKFNAGSDNTDKANYHYYNDSPGQASVLNIVNCSLESFAISAIRIAPSNVFRKIVINSNNIALPPGSSSAIIDIDGVDHGGTIVGNYIHAATLAGGTGTHTGIKLRNTDGWLIGNQYYGCSDNVDVDGTATDITAMTALDA